MRMIEKSEKGADFFLIPLGVKTSDGTGEFYLNATTIMTEAVKVDAKNGYDSESRGPVHAIERKRAEDYAEYVSQFANAETADRFSTSGYSVLPLYEGQT